MYFMLRRFLAFVGMEVLANQRRGISESDCISGRFPVPERIAFGATALNHPLQHFSGAGTVKHGGLKVFDFFPEANFVRDISADCRNELGYLTVVRPARSH